MYLGVLCPFSEGLAIKPEDYPSGAPQQNQTHIGHDGRDISTLDDPRSDELRETISPDIFIHGNRNKNRSGDWLVAVNGIRGRDGR